MSIWAPSGHSEVDVRPQQPVRVFNYVRFDISQQPQQRQGAFPLQYLKLSLTLFNRLPPFFSPFLSLRASPRIYSVYPLCTCKNREGQLAVRSREAHSNDTRCQHFFSIFFYFYEYLSAFRIPLSGSRGCVCSRHFKCSLSNDFQHTARGLC